jgi:hypothetical protein
MFATSVSEHSEPIRLIAISRTESSEEMSDPFTVALPHSFFKSKEPLMTQNEPRDSHTLRSNTDSSAGESPIPRARLLSDHNPLILDVK